MISEEAQMKRFILISMLLISGTYLLANQYYSLPDWVNKVQDLYRTGDGRRQVLRAAHARAYGCLNATLKVSNDLPDSIKVGLFKESGKEFPAMIRFSSGSGSSNKTDKDADFKGFAIKIGDIQGPAVQNPQAIINVQDFLFTNRPSTFIKTPEEQLEFFEAAGHGKLGALGYFAKFSRFGMFKKFRVDSARKLKSVFTESYWSRVPFLMLNETDISSLNSGTLSDSFIKNPPSEFAQKAVKLVVHPCDQEPGQEPLLSEADFENKADDYLFDDFINTVKNVNSKPLCFKMAVQFFNKNQPIMTPLNDPTQEWRESYKDIAEITIQRGQTQQMDSAVKAHTNTQSRINQPLGSQELESGDCERLAFNPWNGLVSHLPVGEMNFARKDVLAASQKKRGLEFIKPSNNIEPLNLELSK